MRTTLEQHGLIMNMSRKGNPWYNAATESFFGSLKMEWIDAPYCSEQEAKLSLFKYIEMFSNPKRRHSSLGHLSPIEYERRYHNGTLSVKDKAA